jgi:hypothetical protein
MLPTIVEANGYQSRFKSCPLGDTETHRGQLSVAIKIKRNSIWKEKEGKKVIQLVGKATGNRHWTTRRLDKKGQSSHHIHEGTLLKFYEPC